MLLIGLFIGSIFGYAMACILMVSDGADDEKSGLDGKEHINHLNVAQSHFDWATDPGDIDVAIYELKAAEIAVSNYVKEKKETE